MGARILIIEDDPASRELVKYLLESTGHTVLVATEGGSGVRLAIDERPDLILCDLQMPVMSGYEATRTLRQRAAGKAVPIIALTAAALVSEREQALADGMDDFLTKPIDAERLVTTLSRWVGVRRV